METRLERYKIREKRVSILAAIIGLFGTMLMAYSIPRGNKTVLVVGFMVISCCLTHCP